MLDLDPSASRADHEAAIASYLFDTDAQLGAIIAPFLQFDRLEDLTDSDRRRIRSEIATSVRAVLDSEGEAE